MIIKHTNTVVDAIEAEQLANKIKALSYKKKELNEQYDQLNQEIKEACEKLGVGTHFQDDEGTVYQVVVPEMTTVFYKHIDFKRTRRNEEKQGNLSLKAAQEMGYTVK